MSDIMEYELVMDDQGRPMNRIPQKGDYCLSAGGTPRVMRVDEQDMFQGPRYIVRLKQNGPVPGTWEWAWKQIQRESVRVSDDLCVPGQYFFMQDGKLRCCLNEDGEVKDARLTTSMTDSTTWQLYKPKPQTWEELLQEWVGTEALKKIAAHVPPLDLINGLIEAVVSLPGFCTVPPDFVVLMEEARQWKESRK